MTFGQASDPETEQCRRETLKYLHHVEEPEELDVSPEEIQYMQAIKRDEMLDVRGGSGGRMRKKLCGEPLKLIEARLVSPGGRGNAYTQLYLTERGERFLHQIDVATERQ